METSTVNSVTVSFGDDNIILPLGSASSCWRYSEDQEAQTREKQSRTDIQIYETDSVVVKTENIEDNDSPTEKSNSSASVGNVLRIKDKSKVEREYAANAVKKVNDLLRNSELSHDESDYAIAQTDEANPLSQEEVQEDESVYANNPTDNQFSQPQVPFFPGRSSSQHVDTSRISSSSVAGVGPFFPGSSSQHVDTSSLSSSSVSGVGLVWSGILPGRSSSQHVDTSSISSSSVSGVGPFFPSRSSSQHVETSSISSSSVSAVGSSSAAFTSNQYHHQEESEQVIKLIHTSDATLPYMCSACNMHSSNLGVMKQHIADHKKGVIKCPLLGLSKNVFICPFGNCDFNSPNYARVLTHLNRFHGSVAQHLIKQITSASLPEAVESLNDPVSPLCQRESIWKEVALQKKPKVQSKLYACSECNFRDYDYKTVIVHLQGHLNQNKKQKTG